MTINLKHRFFPISGPLSRRIESGIKTLGNIARIERADVVVERRRTESPPFQATLHLAVPGPDLHASAEGFTPESAWDKAVAKIGRVARDRKARLALRQKQAGESMRTWNRPSRRLAFS